MRILRIDDWSGAPGGGQEYVRSVSDELEARGHENWLLNITDSPPSLTRPDESYAPIPRAPARRFPTDLLGNRALERELGRLVTTFQPDIVHLHHFGAGFGTIARVLPSMHVPLVFTAHDAELVCPVSTLVQPGPTICDGGIRPRCLFTGCPVGVGGPLSLYRARTFERAVLPHIRAFLCPSTLLARYLDSNGFRPAVHLPSFARIPPAVAGAVYPGPTASVPPTVGFLGRLEWYKGVDDLIDAIALLARRIPSVQLEIAGEGSLRAELEARARRRGIVERTTFRGDLRGEAKEDWFRRIHLLAVPSSQWENFGLVALEAHARGRPVVATNFGGLPDIVVDGQTGWLVPLSSPGALADAIEKLLADPDTASRMGAAGRQRVFARFTPELHVDRLLAVYRAVLAGTPLRSLSEADEVRASGAPAVTVSG
ncbi:MAG TPA: glycosyltransferase family 4 protein [Thermoplasmata archaeon]|nr:glycosyltransferase family 4 protein [Thermoplasmata archaeon]